MFAQIGVGQGEGFKGLGHGCGIHIDGVLAGGVGAQRGGDEDGHGFCLFASSLLDEARLGLDGGNATAAPGMPEPLR